VPVVLAGLFLTFGTFASGEAHRLIDSSLLDAAGLWLQLLAVVVATIAAAGMTIRTYRTGDVVRSVRRTRTILANRTAQVMGIVLLALSSVRRSFRIRCSTFATRFARCGERPFSRWSRC
jgi:hypothetical protein